ncbi:phosphatase [Oceanidesulfovibrio indonesiensis]|uniref:Phosphatase n=1 Tax=Oceanidesulfovibrio indonesiensis TaxID=54767 RepID=A0A7M3MHB2_9BACT|nr:PHP domain-containing protein [Oceanidesulfovibrio indonesiensis]TVM18879.1 phosphatase [Oceanidesulfovibrio indonesiensis]
MPEIDLHTHSTASDGSYSPEELVTAAKNSGLSAIALTDHDTLNGLDRAARTALDVGIEFIPGCELTVTHGALRFHLVALWLPLNAVDIQNALDEIIRHRNERNHIIIGKLNDLGIGITYEDVLAKAGDGAVGRPHFAAALLEKGVVTSAQEAFDRYLGSTGKAYEPKKVLTAAHALDLLQRHGATPVLAHPYQIGLGKDELASLILELKEMGLDAIEAYYSEHSPSQTRSFLELAKRLDLGVSGGSDFHGPIKPDIKLGTGRGRLDIPYAVLEDLKKRRLNRGQPTETSPTVLF